MAWRTFVVFASLLATLAGAGPSFAGPFAPAPAFRERPVSTPAQASLLNDYRGQLKRAMDAEQAGDWAGAEQALDQAIRLGGRLRITARELAGLETDKAGVLMDQGRYDDAETLLKQALSALDARDRRGAVYTTEAYFKLGQLYMREARWKEAVEMLSRAIETSPRGDTRDELARLEIEDALAIAYVDSGRADLAVPFFNEELQFYRRNPAQFAEEIAGVQNHLAIVNQTRFQTSGDQDAFNDAVAEFDEAYQIDKKLFGVADQRTIIALSNRGVLLGLAGRNQEAAPMLSEALRLSRQVFGDDDLKTAHAANNLAWVDLGGGNASEALSLFRPSLAIYLKQRALQRAGSAARGYGVDEREVGRTILGFLRSARALASADPKEADFLANEAFVAAQSVHNAKAAEALALTTARFAAGESDLAVLIRQRQDLADRHKSLDDALTASLGQQARDPNAERGLRDEMAKAEAAVAGPDAQIASRFPEYSALADPKPLTIDEARAGLSADEALVLITPFGYGNGEDGFTFVVSREAVAWRSIGAGVGVEALTSWVQTLRCGLDGETWDERESRERCQSLTGVKEPSRLPFNAGAAYQLFETLFGDLAPSLKGKTLLTSTGEPLSSLPMQVLVTEKPPADYPDAQALGKLAWLGRSNPIAVLPSPASLRGLRSAQPSRAPEPFLGVGDPALYGSPGCGVADIPETCPTARTAPPTLALAPTRSAARIEVGARRGGEMANLAEVRGLCPLPETAFELRCVASSIGAAPSSVLIGPEATLPALRALALDRYRILHFATHGLLAGDMETASGSVAEPALVLTPPAAPTANDDGLLRASEIATLKLDADWVILSACNTAAGEELGGEAMSGLASAFLYAGARALLVSHWPVQSDAAVLLTTTTFSELAAHPELSRAEALRRAVVSLIDNPSGAYADPSVWAPFSLVGAAGPIRR